MLKKTYLPAWMLLSLWLASCATLTATPHQTLNVALDAAQSVATAANDTIATLVTAKTITADQAEKLGASADTVSTTVQLARRLLRSGDAAGAQAQLLALAADIAYLQDFTTKRHAP